VLDGHCTATKPSTAAAAAAGQCWTGISRDGVQAFYRQLNDKFNSGNINNLFGLDQFPADDTEALVLAAKMSLLQVNLYQQLILLGSAQGENSTLKAFAATAAAKIGVSEQAVFWVARTHAPVVTTFFTWAHPM
jgi:hypothetical protein